MFQSDTILAASIIQSFNGSSGLSDVISFVRPWHGAWFTCFKGSALPRGELKVMVLQKINGRWEHMNEIRELAFRESLIGASVDLFVDLCLEIQRLGALKSSGFRRRSRREVVDGETHKTK